MKRKIFAKSVFPLILAALMTFEMSTELYSQNKKKIKHQELRNNWSLGLNYGENGFGPFVGYYIAAGKSTDINFTLSFSGVTDSREVERYDVYGNSIVMDKVNRVFMIPLSIGIKKELFKGDIEGSFSPLLNLGISPTLVLTNPYSKSFFSAVPYTQTHFAIGGYAGMGVNFRQSETISMNVNINYYYIPLLGDGVQSLNYNTIKNVGGLQLAFGVNFLK